MKKNIDCPHGNHEFALGKHMTVEYYDCDSEILANPRLMEDVFSAAAVAGGATVLGSNFHSFEPQGVSGFIIIAESHLSVHSWPEHDYAAVDIFTCGESVDFEKAVDSLKQGMKADSVIISNVMNRGIVSNNGIERVVPVSEDRTHLYALSWKKRFEATSAWGLLASVDIYECAPELIRDAAVIKRFVVELCDRINIRRYGECEVTNFSDNERVAGFSMTQLIGNSLISGHFANESNNAYLDIFSCKFFEPREAAEFAISFFKGANYRMQVALRR